MKRPYHIWKAPDMKVVVDNPNMTDKELSSLLNIDAKKIASFRLRQRLLKTNDFLRMVGKRGGRPVINYSTSLKMSVAPHP